MLRLALLVAAVAGCHIDLNDPGTDPPVKQLYFPVGLAYDAVPRTDGHVDRYLYVSNGNADLRFGGGTVQIVDVRRFECAVWRYCQSHDCPDTLKIDPICDDDAVIDADVAFQPSANEAECQPDPLDPSVIDCDETPFIVGNATVRVGNFAGGIRLLKTGAEERRLFVSVRGDPSITWMDVHLGGLRIGSEPPPPLLDCFDSGTKVASPPAPGCHESHVLFNFSCTGRPGCNVEFPTIPSEPFGMRLDSGALVDGTPYARLLVSALSTGQVTLIDALGGNADSMIRNVSAAFFQADSSGRHGAFALAPQHAHDPTSSWYMTSNLQPTIATFRVANAEVIVPSISFSFGGAFAIGSDVRDIQFEPGGNRAFLTENNPPSLLVLDTRTTDMRNPGQPLNQLVDIVNVCQTPSHMGVRRAMVAGAPGTPARLKTDVYVVCFLSNQVMVVDPDAPGVEDTILVGRGPNEVVFNFGDSDDPDAPLTPPARRAFVSQYSEMSIAVIDVDPGSPTRNRMVARIGKPLPPPKP
jgi:YVTN family beta-propeller protein